jgi:hypothetical protein
LEEDLLANETKPHWKLSEQINMSQLDPESQLSAIDTEEEPRAHRLLELLPSVAIVVS